MKLIAATVFAVSMGLQFTPQPALARDAWNHVDEVAFELRRDTAKLYREVARNFQGTPEYPHLVNDALQMYRLADAIHATTHNVHGYRFLETTMKQFDELLHHMEEITDEMHTGELSTGHVFSHAHGHGVHHGGRVSNFRVERLQSMLRDLDEVLVHLNADLQELRQHYPPSVPGLTTPTAPAPAVVPPTRGTQLRLQLSPRASLTLTGPRFP